MSIGSASSTGVDAENQTMLRAFSALQTQGAKKAR
jgi:hypothetical protein